MTYTTGCDPTMFVDGCMSHMRDSRHVLWVTTLACKEGFLEKLTARAAQVKDYDLSMAIATGGFDIKASCNCHERICSLQDIFERRIFESYPELRSVGKAKLAGYEVVARRSEDLRKVVDQAVVFFLLKMNTFDSKREDYSPVQRAKLEQYIISPWAGLDWNTCLEGPASVAYGSGVEGRLKYDYSRQYSQHNSQHSSYQSSPMTRKY